MPLVNFYATLQLVQTYRVLHLSGHPGAGKTSLAFRIAYELLSSGFSRYLLTNIRSVWADDPSELVPRDGTYLDAVIILDEGGLFIHNIKQARAFVAYLRKMNTVLLLPSVEVPAPRMRALQIERVNRYELPGGRAVWKYETRLNDAVISRFYWVNPSEIYGVYDTQDFAWEAYGVQSLLSSHTRKLTQERLARSVVIDVPEMELFGEGFDDEEDSGDDFDDDADDDSAS